MKRPCFLGSCGGLRQFGLSHWREGTKQSSPRDGRLRKTQEIGRFLPSCGFPKAEELAKGQFAWEGQG